MTNNEQQGGINLSETTLAQKYQLTWDGIVRNSNKVEKRERLVQYLRVLSTFIHDEIKKKNSQEIPKEDSILFFIERNHVLATLTRFIIECPNTKDLFLEYVSYYLRLLKYQDRVIRNTQLMNAIFKVILELSSDLDDQGASFEYRNEYALFLNVVVRLLLNYPVLIPFFKVRKKNPYTHREYEEFFIFSSLMSLLEIDHLIKTFEYKKYIRRSLIVYLSFDEINNSFYLQQKSIFVELLVNKLCNYYQMLPTSFDFEEATRTLEAGCNIHLNFHVLTPLYFEYSDYITFLNKISNCFTSENIRTKFKHYFFNKFLIQNVQQYLLSDDLKITRSHFQYLVTLLRISKNAIMVDSIINFLFGFSESKISRKFKIDGSFKYDPNKPLEMPKEDNSKKNENISLNDYTFDFDYAAHQPSGIALKILNNLSQSVEHANVVFFELFEILFEKRPYLMIKKFVKPYTDFVLKKVKNKSSKLLFQNKSYPITKQLIELLNFYKNYDTTSMLDNVEYSMFKNFAYYINYDIDFYSYYQKNEDDLMNNNMRNTRSSVCNNSISRKGTYRESLSVDTLMQCSMETFNNRNDFEEFVSTINKDDEEISLDQKLFSDIDSVDEGIQNMNFLLMKSLHEKLVNFFNNDNLENIFLTNLLITIISVPSLDFDQDLVQCTAVLLDDDAKSQYSFLTVFRYLSQQILKILRNDDKKKALLKKFIQILFKIYNNASGTSNQKEGGKTEKESESGEKGEDNNREFENDFLVFLLKKNNKGKVETTNYIIFCEFIKEFICSISHKHKFEGLIEGLYDLYCDKLKVSEHSEEDEK